LGSRLEPKQVITRPVCIIQTNLLNKIPHPSTIICPITTNVRKDSEILRVHLQKGIANLQQASDIMIYQIRAIDNKRLTRRVGILPEELIAKIKENIQIVLGSFERLIWYQIGKEN